MKVRFKRLTPDAVMPKPLRNNGGLALVATSKIFDKHGNATYGTGISVDIPVGYVGFILPLKNNYQADLTLSPSIGVIEPGNHEEVVLRFRPAAFFTDECKDGDEEGVGSDSNTFDYIAFGKQYIEDNDITNVYNIGDLIGRLFIFERPVIEPEEVMEITSGDLTNDVPYQGSTQL